MQITQEQAEFLRKQHIQICIPCYGGQVFECVMVSMLKFTILANRIGMNFSLDTMVNESLITRGRNNLVAKVMHNPASTHLFFIDADIGFEPEHIFQLVLHDKEVVGGFYPKKSLPIDYVVNVSPDIKNVVKDDEKRNEFVKGIRSLIAEDKSDFVEVGVDDLDDLKNYKLDQQNIVLMARCENLKVIKILKLDAPSANAEGFSKALDQLLELPKGK